MSDKTFIRPGRYRHYKGNEYTVLGTGRIMRPQQLICIRDVRKVLVDAGAKRD